MALSRQAASTGETGAADTPSPQRSGLAGLQLSLLEHKFPIQQPAYVSMQTPDLGLQIPLHESDAKSMACRC